MEALRQLPPVNDVLKCEELRDYRNLLTQPFVITLLQAIFQETRGELAHSTSIIPRPALISRIATELRDRIRESLSLSLCRVINASGVVLHTNLGRAPLPAEAIQELREVSVGYSNLEFDVATGVRGRRDNHAEKSLQRLLGCEAAVVVNNNAAAVLLVLNTLGEGGEVVASRGEQVEIGGSFRIPEVMAKSGARLREVGTTNRTRIKDYEKAINERTRLLLRVHPSNFRMIGFTERPSLEEFADLGRRRNIPTFEDLGSGCLIDMEFLGVHDEPVVQQSIAAGVDIICFSGDKLLGGPQAGIIAGKKLYIETVRRNPLFRALRVDKLTLSVLDYVLRTYLEGHVENIPIWRMLRATPEELRNRSQQFAKRAGGIAQPIQLKSVVGGGSAPETYVDSWGVALSMPNMSMAELERRMRASNPPVIVRVEENRVILDFRTIFPNEEEELLGILGRIA
jgi:L-seryl-tRNA(Ser) seleniumtransferase